MKRLGKNHSIQVQTVEAYAICYYCGCQVDCNPCSTVPAAAYISQRDARNDIAALNARDAVKAT